MERHALFLRAKGEFTLDQALLDRVEQRMRALAEQALPITKRSVNTDDAIDIFQRSKMLDKARLFHYRIGSRVNIYTLDGFSDYFYGYMEFFMKKISLLSSRIFYAQFMKNEEKLACLLYSETADASCVSYTHEQIAAVTGMSRVSATKIMNGFSEQGLITQEYRKIRVTDRPGLLAIFRAKEFY